MTNSEFFRFSELFFTALNLPFSKASPFGVTKLLTYNSLTPTPALQLNMKGVFSGTSHLTAASVEGLLGTYMAPDSSSKAPDLLGAMAEDLAMLQSLMLTEMSTDFRRGKVQAVLQAVSQAARHSGVWTQHYLEFCEQASYFNQDGSYSYAFKGSAYSAGKLLPTLMIIKGDLLAEGSSQFEDGFGFLSVTVSVSQSLEGDPQVPGWYPLKRETRQHLLTFNIVDSLVSFFHKVAIHQRLVLIEKYLQAGGWITENLGYDPHSSSETLRVTDNSKAYQGFCLTGAFVENTTGLDGFEFEWRISMLPTGLQSFSHTSHRIEAITQKLRVDLDRMIQH